jgi:hypothetical protein
MIVLFFLLISSLPLHLSASNFWPIPGVLKHEFVGTKQCCLKGILKRIAQFLIIQGDNRIAVPFETGGSQSCTCSGNGSKPTVQIETSQPRSSTRKVKLI